MTARVLVGNRCQCPSCGDWFNSTSTFDRHRIGPFETAQSAGARRCLTVAEMIDRGWSRNEAGFWIERRRKASTVRAQAPRRGRVATGVQGVAP
jgi:hypothetical protein